MKKFWDDYGWLIALAVFATIILRAFWGREPFCGVKDEQCFREWVSALSGWVGGAAAIITILVISNHHRENIKLQNVPIFRTAQLARESCTMLRTLCDSLDGSLNQSGIQGALITLKEISAILSGEVIRDFELKIGSADASGLVEAKALTSAVIQVISEFPKPNPLSNMAQWIDIGPVKAGSKNVIVNVKRYANAVDAKAQDYIRRYSQA